MSKLPETYTGPGLFDVQLNGYAGVDFNEDAPNWSADKLHHVRRAMARRGVMAALITIVTDDTERIIARVGRYAELISADDELAACFPKLHIEGPFLSPADGPRGAHPKEYCISPADAPDFLDRLRDASGDRIAILTLAPELPGAIELTRCAAEAGVCVAIGHTQASNEDIAAAVAAGARMSTHLGNGSHQQMPRLDNYVQTQLADDRLTASFIADSHHVPLTTLKNFIRAKTPGNSVLTTDAILAADLGPGEYHIVGKATIVREDGRVSRPGEDNLAGSSATLDTCVIRTCLHCDVSFEQAWAMASTIPARLLGMAPPPEVTVRVSEDGFEAQG